MKKIAIIGSGNVGSTTALSIAQKELGEIILVDIINDLPKGIALDISESSPIHLFDSDIIGTNDYSQIKNSDIVIITAGLARKPGMDRMDLLKINANIVKEITEKIKEYASQSIILVVSNPIDLMVYIAYKISGFPKNRVLGMAGVLDSARFATFISMELNVSIKDISAMVLGGHGDKMVPLPKYTTVSGISINELISEDRINFLIKRTQEGGAEIVNYLKTGSAYYAPAAATTIMIESILKKQNRILPTSCYVEGEYSLNGYYIGVPAILGSNGIEKIIELKLDSKELNMLQENGFNYRKNIEELHSELNYL